MGFHAMQFFGPRDELYKRGYEAQERENCKHQWFYWMDTDRASEFSQETSRYEFMQLSHSYTQNDFHCSLRDVYDDDNGQACVKRVQLLLSFCSWDLMSLLCRWLMRYRVSLFDFHAWLPSRKTHISLIAHLSFKRSFPLKRQFNKPSEN